MCANLVGPLVGRGGNPGRLNPHVEEAGRYRFVARQLVGHAAQKTLLPNGDNQQCDGLGDRINATSYRHPQYVATVLGGLLPCR